MDIHEGDRAGSPDGPRTEELGLRLESPSGGLPPHKELEREIGEYLMKKYGGRVRVVSQTHLPMCPRPGEEGVKEGGRAESAGGLPSDLKPEELEAYLDEYVIRQSGAKAVLATKVCTHFNRIAYLRKRHREAIPAGCIKNNIILIGPTGVGKTFLVKLLAARLGVPFVKGDATKFSETGYVGADVEDLVRDLVDAADGDMDLAQCGIIYLDEIDKIAARHPTHGPDVSRAGVQRALLKPLEETDVDLRVPHDPISQIEAIERYRKSGKREKRTINTRNILFVASGAFHGLSDIVRRRLRRQGIGFGADLDLGEERDWLRFLKPQDLIEYGFESEFVGRFPVIAILDELSEEDLYEILRSPKSAVILGKRQDFMAYGIDLRFEDEALRLLAHQAYEERTGARSLVSVVEKALLPFEKRLPSTTITHLVVTRGMVEDPEASLAELLENPEDPDRLARYRKIIGSERDALIKRIRNEGLPGWEEAGIKLTETRLSLVAGLAGREEIDPEKAGEEVLHWISQIRAYEASFYNRIGIRIRFEDDAIDFLLEDCFSDRSHLHPLCERLCNILEYGLPLVRERTARTEFSIPAEAVKNAELYINILLRTCYTPPAREKAR